MIKKVQKSFKFFFQQFYLTFKNLKLKPKIIQNFQKTQI